MQCRSCQSTRHAELSAEIAIHLPDLENLNTPHVYVFPDIAVCLDGGPAGFKVPEADLQSVRERLPQLSRARELIARCLPSKSSGRNVARGAPPANLAQAARDDELSSERARDYSPRRKPGPTER